MNILAIIKSRLKGVLQARKTEKAITKVCVVSSVTETGTFEAAPGGISLDLEGGSNSDWLKQTFLFYKCLEIAKLKEISGKCKIA